MNRVFPDLDEPIVCLPSAHDIAVAEKMGWIKFPIGEFRLVELVAPPVREGLLDRLWREHLEREGGG